MASKYIGIQLSCLQKFSPSPLFSSKNFKTPPKKSSAPPLVYIMNAVLTSGQVCCASDISQAEFVFNQVKL